MSAPVDFFALYRELGIDPECSPEDFKRAYRRRVWELHPDRSGERMAGEEALKTLNLGYAAALEFFRAHGRFPGAAIVQNPHAGMRTRAHAPVQAPRPADEAADDMVGEEPPTNRRWLRLALAGVAVLFAVSQFEGLRPGEDDTGAMDEVLTLTPPSAQRARVSPASEASLAIGMPSREVLSLLGAPTDTTQDGREWHYGPSWIRMSCGQVRDWYSSPLKPLGASRMRPPPGEGQDDDAGTQPCVERTPDLRQAR